MECHTSIKNYLRLDKDILVIDGPIDYTEHIPKLRARKHAELAEKYGAEEGSCMSYLLEMVSNEMIGDLEFRSLSSFTDPVREKWADSEIGHAVAEMERLGAISLYSVEEYVEYRTRLHVEMKEAVGDVFGDLLKEAFGNTMFEILSVSTGPDGKVMEINEKMTKEDYDWLHKFDGSVVYADVKCVNESGMGKFHEKDIVEVIDLRGMPVEERALLAAKKRRQYRRRVSGPAKTREERLAIVAEAVRSFKGLKHITETYLSGSHALELDTDQSDIDVTLTRTRCPGKEKCAGMFDYPIDLYCFTEKQLEDYRRKNYMFTLMTVPVS